VFTTRVIFYFNNNADNILIGRFLGSSALGIYAVAYNVMLAPLSRIAAPVVEVFTPAFARLQDDTERMASLWLRALRLVGTLMIPGMLGLVLVAPEFVHVLLGERWSDAVPVIQILTWVGLLQCMQRFNSSILQARNRTRTLLFCSIVTVVCSLAAFVVGLQWGIVGVAAAYAVSSTVAEPYYAWRTMRTVGVTVRRYLANLAGIATAALAMGAAVLGTRLFVLSPDLPDGARLAVLVTVGAVTFVPFWAWLAPQALDELRGLRRRRSRIAPLAPAQPSGRPLPRCTSRPPGPTPTTAGRRRRRVPASTSRTTWPHPARWWRSPEARTHRRSSPTTLRRHRRSTWCSAPRRARR